MRRLSTGLVAVAVVLAAAGPAAASTAHPQSAAHKEQAWTASWATAMQGTYPQGYAVAQPGIPDAQGQVRLGALPGDRASDQTFRMIVKPNVTGHTWRLRLSNAFGTAPVTFNAVSLAEQLSGATVRGGSLRGVTFGGRTSVTLAPGEVRASDPIEFRVSKHPSPHVAISLSVAGQSGPIPWHAASFATSYISAPGSGDHTQDTQDDAFTQPTTSWFYVAGLDVERRDTATVVALGDSITDGFFSTLNGDDRWPDQLQQRLDAGGKGRVSVVNEGIGGNMVTSIGRPAGGCTPCDGPPVPTRLERDVLSQPGVRAVVLLIGINDLGGGGATSESVIAGLKETVNQLHGRGIRVMGATITPSGGAFDGYGTWATDAKRRVVNEFIRTSGTFDAVADFDAAVRDPADPSRLKPEYDTNSTTGGPGDHLHPNRAGFMRMADAVPLNGLSWFTRTDPAPLSRRPCASHDGLSCASGAAREGEKRCVARLF